MVGDQMRGGSPSFKPVMERLRVPKQRVFVLGLHLAAA